MPTDPRPPTESLLPFLRGKHPYPLELPESGVNLEDYPKPSADPYDLSPDQTQVLNQRDYNLYDKRLLFDH